MKQSETDEVRNLLFANTKSSLVDGAFGLPWFVATNSLGQSEGFFGFDHLAQVLDHLGLEVTDTIKNQEHGWGRTLGSLL